MLRKFLLASVGAFALTSSAALAADLPSRAPPPIYVPPVPIFTWTGIYVGGQVGYAWGQTHNHFVTAFPGIAVFADDSFGQNPNGVIGGAHVGYNYQINQWVLGLEGSVDGTSMKKTVLFAPGAAFFAPVGFFGSGVTATTRADIQGSIRGRIGVAWDRALIYATGGVAFGGFNTSYTFFSPFFALGGTSSFSTTRVGWTVGGGIEYAVTNNWSVRAEYRYTDFGRTTYAPFSTVFAPFGGGFTGHHHFTQNQVQVGFSYKFDTFAPVPVVAKY
ncbi:porin family protein [Beijerinckiaceae bacterium]|nr:porin family protein [Beijerinckiaceae bacterium]